MSVPTARTGSFAYLRYGWETTFKGGATVRDKVFGRGQRVTSLVRRENPELIAELGERRYLASAFKQFEAGLTVEWVLSNPWFFRALLGSVTTSGTGPYTHTYSVTKLPQTMAVEIGMQASGGNVVRVLEGVVFNSVSLTASVGELVRVRGELMAAEELPVGNTLSSALVDSFEPFVFHHARLEIPSGTVIGEVQAVDMTINNNALGVWGLGDRIQTSAVWQTLDVAMNVSVTLKNASFLNYLASEVASARLVIQRDASNSIIFNLADLVFGEHSVTYEPNALVIESLPIQARTLASVVAVNNVGTHP